MGIVTARRIASRGSIAAPERPRVQVARSALTLWRRRVFGLEQAVEVDDDIFHLGVVDGALGGAAPRFLGLGIAVEQPDEVDGV